VPRFDYPCPGCRTTSNLHEADCEFDGTPWQAIESAYVDVFARLSERPWEPDALRADVDGWDRLHAATLERLQRDQRVVDEDGTLRLLTAAEYKERVTEPTMEPLNTIYEKGSVPGAHDNSVFALIAFYEMVGLSWEETREQVVGWLHDSDTWRRGGFEEDTPEQLVEAKKHVYDQGYGWKEKARAAKAVIDRHVD
jgi:hypothetical protein